MDYQRRQVVSLAAKQRIATDVPDPPPAISAMLEDAGVVL
jgi:hypothetical protein